MTTAIELKVLYRQKGLASQKSSFVVEYEGKEHKVPMFGFQETEETPEYIMCNVNDGVLSQDIGTLFDRFYPDKGIPYIFKIKNKWTHLKYYDVVDPRTEKENIRTRLIFSESTPDLEKGQLVKCVIKEIKGGKLILRMNEGSAIVMEFRALESIFNKDIKVWLDGLFSERHMSEIKKMYDEQDGRWIFGFAQVIEEIIYRLLSERNDGQSALREFCMSWLNTVEYSPFLVGISEEQSKTYGKDMMKSIEICEDFLDAINMPDKDNKVGEYINSLDPRFYQFRTEKRFRVLSCVFSLDFSQLEKNIKHLLDKVKVMGESKCCNGGVSIALRYILKLYVDNVSKELEDALSCHNEANLAIKNCVLSLCYLTRIMYWCGDGEVSLYASRLYQLLSLSNIQLEEEKQKLLRNSYTSLFISKYPLANYRWESFDAVVNNFSYLFCREDVPYDKSLHLVYCNEDTRVELSNGEFSIAPINTPNSEMTSMRLLCGLSANLCYGKSLSKLSQEVDFGNVLSTWSMVEKSVFSPVKVIQKKDEKLSDGDEVAIYIMEIIDSETARCKAVDYDEEGTILFKDLFFYYRPKLTIGDFLGVDGSPMLFPAEYRNCDGDVTFSSHKYKLEYAKEMMPRGRVTCCVISRKEKHCVGILPGGFFVSFYSDNEDIKPICFVDVIVPNVKSNGYADAELCDFSETKFDNGKSYSNYLKGMNNYFFGIDGTVAKANSPKNEMERRALQSGTITVSENFVRTLAGIVYKMSRLEKDLRQRYGYLYICSMLSKLIHDDKATALYSTRMKYIRMLYDFSINNRLIEMDVENFVKEMSGIEDIREVCEMENVIRILGKYGKPIRKNTLDSTLVSILTTDSTPLEKEISRLVLSGNMLANFGNKAIEDHILEELGHKLNINIVKKEPVSIGLEEGETVEFKTSIVYPPTGDGSEDIELQSENIARVISSMMNAEGGTLYVGVNDVGNVVGIQSDLEYFSNGGVYEEVKAKDKFKNYISWFLTNKFGAVTASKFKYDFEEIQGYTIFKVLIPQIPDAGGDFIRVGSTCQRK